MSATEDMCGHFSLMFIHEWIFNQELDFHTLINDLFTNDKELNKLRVISYLNENFPNKFQF